MALVKPNETRVIDVVGPDGDVRFQHDVQQVRHLPNQVLLELIIA